ncbi:Cytochrome c551 peroxidase [Chondromyces apiculatus DSM 436]|uniref:Cytochrome c551 peroxidase n=2 Tax=Chondromyces apiculatus TaxID=51 RepID=A0A017TFH6_9BACT|nr:Cytochrome c551 peroxidase [Chondromyces apiculatus DSM 436]
MAALLAACRDDPSPPLPPSPVPPLSSAALSAASATTAAPRRAPLHEGGALARALDEDALYLADEDHHVLRRIPLPVDVATPPTALPLPGPPASVLALHGRVLVTVRGTAPASPGAPLRGPGLLLVLQPDSAAGLREQARIELPADAWGLAVTPDETLAIITSAWTHRVTAVDLPADLSAAQAALRVRWSVDVAREPRGVVVRPDGDAAYVTHLVHASLTRLDNLRADHPTTRLVPFPAAPLRTTPARVHAATLGYAPVLSPEGDRLYLARQALGATGKRAWNGQPTVDVLLTDGETPLAEPAGRMYMMQSETFTRRWLSIGRPVDLTITGPGPTQMQPPFVQPRAARYRKATRTLLVASEGTDALVELDALAIDPSAKPLRTYDLGLTPTFAVQIIGNFLGPPEPEPPAGTTRCGAPSGIALSADEATAWVFCRSSHDLAIVRLDPHDPAHPFEPSPIPTVSLGPDPLPAQAALGRRLFYNALDQSMSNAYACNACHPEGRDDGHVWREEEYREVEHSAAESPWTAVNLHAYDMHIRGFDKAHDFAMRGAPRQTPMLAGRVDAPGPYGWKGRSPSLRHRVVSGFRIHRWHDDFFAAYGAGSVERAEALAAFLRQGLVPPPRHDRPLDADEARGRAVFENPDVGCAECHVPTTDTTHRQVVGLGAFRVASTFEREREHDRFKTPSLRYVGGTPPYFHDGSEATLADLIDHNGTRMGHTRQLSPEDRKALVAFLETL